MSEQSSEQPSEEPKPHPHAGDMLIVQKYLGLKSPSEIFSKGNNPANNTDPAAFSDVVFLSVDLEAYEFAQDKITEIGVSVLDTRNLAGIEPGPNASAWLSRIKTRHLRISEYKKLVNKRFITGCAEKFNFGTSEFIQLNQSRSVLAQIFNNPAGVQNPMSDKRRIVLVGHGLKNDTDYLKILNFSPQETGTVIRNIDTQNLAGSSKRDSVGLERVLRGLGADPVNLHNAGNDAAYTLQALVMMAVQHTEMPGGYLAAIKTLLMPETQKQKNRRFAKEKRKAKLAEKEAQAARNAQNASVPQDSVDEGPKARKFQRLENEHEV